MRSEFYTNKNTENSTLPYIFKPYTDSEIKAIALGYTEIQDERAFNGRYFIKDGKKWIHNIEALRRKLNKDYVRYIDDDELSVSAPEGFGYGVEAYYLYNSHSDNWLSKNKQWNKLLNTCNVSRRFN
ncbi:hypothetical protein ACWA5Z_12805 [Testudinibacter sp. P80/BLE/0925]|uniref:hypothetical protein n=1 Tax=Testudinibacter sp. TW-1 TaxID=3417757 RepID=UPI003D36D5E7